MFVGNGNPRFAAAFRQEHLGGDASVHILCDPARVSYRALKFRRSLLSLLDPRVVGRGLLALKAGFRQADIQGDALQNGGVLLVDADATIRYHYASRFSGDHPDPQDVLRAARAACKS